MFQNGSFFCSFSLYRLAIRLQRAKKHPHFGSFSLRSILTKALYEFRTADDHKRGATGRFRVRRQADEIPGGISGAWPERRVGHGTPACRRFGFGNASEIKVLQPGESAIAAACVGPGAQVPGKRAGIPRRRGSIRPRHSAAALQNSPESIKSLNQMLPRLASRPPGYHSAGKPVPTVHGGPPGPRPMPGSRCNSFIEKQFIRAHPGSPTE